MDQSDYAQFGENRFPGRAVVSTGLDTRYPGRIKVPPRQVNPMHGVSFRTLDNTQIRGQLAFTVTAGVSRPVAAR